MNIWKHTQHAYKISTQGRRWLKVYPSGCKSSHIHKQNATTQAALKTHVVVVVVAVVVDVRQLLLRVYTARCTLSASGSRFTYSTQDFALSSSKTSGLPTRTSYAKPLHLAFAKHLVAHWFSSALCSTVNSSRINLFTPRLFAIGSSKL